MFSHAARPLCGSASWPFLSSGLPGGLHGPVLLLKLCTQGLGMAAAVSLGNFTASPEATTVGCEDLLEPGGSLDQITDAALLLLVMETLIFIINL